MLLVNSNRIKVHYFSLIGLFFSSILLFFVLGCSSPSGDRGSSGAATDSVMAVADLDAMPKIDAHAHIFALADSQEAPFLAGLSGRNMRWFTISTMGTEWKKLESQITLAGNLHARYPQQIAWATSFNLENWGRPDWKEEAIKTIEQGFEKGAVAVKVWKDIGMVLKDPDGKYVMIDDTRFDPIFQYIQARGLTLVAHIGEPRNCWLPLDSMTVNNDRKYFAENPQYHAYLHPEIPHYWEHIKARDHVLEKFPNLRVVGCHLGSLEFDVDELAKRFDKYPNFAVDMAARICHFQVQDREKVRNFIIKYQDRLLYGTDLSVGTSYVNFSLEKALQTMDETYRKDYRYFATGEEMDTWEVNGKFRGLALPGEVLKKIFYENARKWYPGIF